MVALDIKNSRMKDFYDVWLLSRQFDLDGETLATAIQKTFERRDTGLLEQPLAFSSEFTKDTNKQTQWKAFVRKLRLESLPNDLSEITGQIQLFLKPVITALSQNKPFKQQWQAGGKWI